MNPKDYTGQAGVTLSNKFHGDKVSLAELRGRLIDGIRAANALDEVKKALFYGKGNDIGATHSTAARTAITAPAMIAGLTRNDGDYPHDAWSEVQATVVLHMVIGKFTEAGELLETLYNALNGEAPPDRVNLLEEVGDGLWYDANMLTALGSSFEEVMTMNNAKLRMRFPEGFTEHDAANRNLNGERELLEDFASGDMLPVHVVGIAEPVGYVSRTTGERVTVGSWREDCPESESEAVADIFNRG